MLKRSLSILAGFLLATPWALWAQTPKANDAGIAAPSAWVQTLISETSCPSVYGILGSGSTSLPSTSGTHSPRIFRNGTPSSCAVPKTWPGVFGSGSYAYDAYTLSNGTGSPQCVNMNLYVYNNEVGNYVHVTVYSGSFNPASIQTNYLADSGSSAGFGGSVGLSFTVGAGQSIVVVLTNPSSSATGQDYLLSYDNLCVTYDRSYLDDLGRTMICYNSITGQYRWSVFSGHDAGMVFYGQADVSNGGNTLLSPSGAQDKLIFKVRTLFNSAYGEFYRSSPTPRLGGSILSDKNIFDDPPSDCIMIRESGKK